MHRAALMLPRLLFFAPLRQPNWRRSVFQTTCVVREVKGSIDHLSSCESPRICYLCARTRVLPMFRVAQRAGSARRAARG